jgi:hypothetical protein
MSSLRPLTGLGGLGASTSQNRMGLHGLLRGSFTFTHYTVFQDLHTKGFHFAEGCFRCGAVTASALMAASSQQCGIRRIVGEFLSGVRSSRQKRTACSAAW